MVTKNIPRRGFRSDCWVITLSFVWLDVYFSLLSKADPGFVVFSAIYHSLALDWLIQQMAKSSFPIDGEKANPKAFKKAFDTFCWGAGAGELVGIFPEGKLSDDGSIDTFRRGVEKIIERTPSTSHSSALRWLMGQPMF